MNLNELCAKVVEVARQNSPGDQVPYAFEKRIMSRLTARASVSDWALWGRPLWRAAVLCVAITALCGWWSVSARKAPETTENLSQSFEATVFAPIDQRVEDAW